jgi:ubiquinone/menaquinone biosynthesis C-methylase UbiE
MIALVLMLAAAVVAPAADELAGLDVQGRVLLAPARYDELPPAALVARLHLRRTAIVADVGAGPGFLTLALAAAVPAGRVIATDVNRDYLAVAAARAQRQGVRNLETRVVPADDPGLAARSVDLAVLLQVDQYLPDRAAYLRKLRAALRPHGRIAIVNFPIFRAPALAAAAAAGLIVVDEWQPSGPYFGVLLAERRESHPR